MAEKYKTAKQIENKSWDAIIIGSGMGGLTTAAALSRRGHRCLVLEQHYVPGGFTHTFQRKGFEWDVGVHVIGDSGVGMKTRKMFDYISEGGLQWEPFGGVYETFRFPTGEKYEFSDDKKKFRQDMENYFPDEKEGIRAYFKCVDSVGKNMALFFASKMFSQPLISLVNAAGLGAKKWRKSTTQTVMDGLGLSDKCRALLLSQWGYYGDAPRDSSFMIQGMVAKHFENGGFYPVGGAPSIARETLKVIRKAGGEVAVRSPVEEFLMENGRVVGVSASHGGERFEFRAKRVFSSVSALTLVNKLLPENLRQSAWAKEISSLRQSPPHLCLYLGFEGDVLKAGATKSSQWVFTTLDMNEKYWDFKQKDLRPPILFCSFPSIKDPQHVPGPTQRHTGEVVTFVDYKEFADWSGSRRGFRPQEYQKMKAEIEERVLTEFKRAFPELGKMIVHHELSTPLSTEFFDRAPEGAIYGLEHTPRRFMSTALRVRSPIPGLFLSGSDIATGGVTGALAGGMIAAATIEPIVLKEMI